MSSEGYRGKPEKDRQELLDYFKRVESLLVASSEVRQDPEQLELFIGNVLEEVKGKESRVCSDLVFSRVLEKIIGLCTPDQFRLFSSRVLGFIGPLMTNRYASHVLQAIVMRIPSTLRVDVHEGDKSHGEDKAAAHEDGQEEGEMLTTEAICNKIAAFCIDEFENVSTDVYGSHVLRALICVMSGSPISANVRSKASQEYRQHESRSAGQGGEDDGPRRKETEVLIEEIPASFLLSLEAIFDKILSLNLAEVATNRSSSPVLQTILSAAGKVNKPMCETMCQKLVGEIKEDVQGHHGTFYYLLTDTVGAHVAEMLFSLISPQQYHSVYVNYFRGKFLELALHRSATFVLHHFLANLSSKEDLSLIVAEILPSIESIFAENKGLVIVRLIGACARLGVLQKEVVKAVFKAFHIEAADDERDCFLLILSMTTLNRMKELKAENVVLTPEEKFTPLGSQLLQELLKFKGAEIKPLINSFLTFSGDDLVAMSMRPHSCRVLEGYVRADIGHKKRHRLLALLKGRLVQMATDRFGSRFIDALWATTEVKEKTDIAIELLEGEMQLKSTMFGVIVMLNCKLDNFRHKQEEWVNTLSANERKKRLFADIIGDDIQKSHANLKVSTKPPPTTPLESSLQYGFVETEEGNELEENETPAKQHDDDELDALFDRLPEKRKLEEIIEKPKSSKKAKKFKDLKGVFAALQEAKVADQTRSSKKEDKKKKKKKSKHEKSS